MFDKITASFPWIVSVCSLFSLIYPPFFIWFRGPLITLGLAGIMLGMGLTLKGSDFVHIVKHPKWRSEERRVGKECRSRWSPYH